MMLGFVVPFKSKLKSQNWEKDIHLLNHTLHSLNNQVIRDFRIYVVFTDSPALDYIDKNIFFLKYPYPFLKVTEIDDYENFLCKHYSDKIGEFMFDQGKKILWGCQQAANDGCNFVMSVDADDLVSNKIAGFVSENLHEQYGWFVNRGYIMKEKSSILIKVKNNMNYLNGSTHIININILPKVNFESKRLEDFTFFSSHGYLRDRIKNAFDETIKPLPFYAIIYLIHNSNWSNYKKTLQKQLIKTFFKYLLRGKWLTNSIKKEFGITG